MATAAHPATIDVGGTPYIRDTKVNLVPLASVKAPDLRLCNNRFKARADNAEG